MPERVWTNSAFGRVLCTSFGAYSVSVPFTTVPDDGSEPWSGWNAVFRITLIVVGIATIVAVWTSRLVLSSGRLTATNFFVSRSMPLVEVVEVDPAFLPFLGMKINGHDRSGLRTLVSGQTWDEWWKPRATRIAEDIVALADKERSAA